MSSPYLDRPVRSLAEVRAERSKRLAASNAIHPASPRLRRTRIPRTRLRELHWPNVLIWTGLFGFWFAVVLLWWAAV